MKQEAFLANLTKNFAAPGVLSRRSIDNDVVRRVFFAVGAQRTQSEVTALSAVLVGLVPGVKADHTRKETGAEMIDEDCV